MASHKSRARIKSAEVIAACLICARASAQMPPLDRHCDGLGSAAMSNEVDWPSHLRPRRDISEKLINK